MRNGFDFGMNYCVRLDVRRGVVFVKCSCSRMGLEMRGDRRQKGEASFEIRDGGIDGRVRG